MTGAVVNFYPLPGEGHRKTCHKIAGFSKSRPVISPVDSLRRHFPETLPSLTLSLSEL